MEQREISLPYLFGSRALVFRLPQANLAGVYVPQRMAVPADLTAEVSRALAQPLDTSPLSRVVRPDEKIVILVDDHTRATPVAQILPFVLNEVRAGGVKDANVTIVIARGTHRASTDEEVRRKVGEDVYGRFRIVQHDCGDEDNQVYVGLTSRGTPVWVNRLVVQADRRIGIGHIGPSPYAGYSGGYKLILPGVASLDTVNANHSLVALGVGQPASVEVPCRQDIEEAGALVGLDMVVDVVLDQDERVVRAFAGSPEAVFREGVALARKVYEVACPEKVDIAITSGHPYGMNLYQAERAVEYADAVVREGGCIVLTAACQDGIGGEEFYRLMADSTKKPEEFLRDIVRRNGKVTFSVLGYLTARIKATKRLYIVTEGIPEAQLETMGFHRLLSLQDGVDILLTKYGPRARVAVFPMGSVTIPFVESG
jgi:nickel-dependent lactate racemase